MHFLYVKMEDQYLIKPTARQDLILPEIIRIQLSAYTFVDLFTV